MMKCPGLLFAALLTIVGLSAAHRRGSSRDNFNYYGRAPPEGFYSWRRNLDRNRQCNEYAYAPPGSQVIYGTSVDSVLPDVGVTPASTVQDFTNAVPVGVIVPVDGPCYYSNSTGTLGQTIDNLNTINNTQIPAVEAIPLDGTATPLTDNEIQSIFAAYPSIEPVCEGRPVIQTYPQGAAPVAYTGPTEVVKVLTLFSAADIRVREDSRDRDRPHRHRHHRHH